jgi:hypothetical protein
MPSYIIKRLLIPVFAIISVYGKAQSEADQKKQDQFAALKALRFKAI